MSRSVRLLRTLRIASRYRLDDFLPISRSSSLPRALLAVFRFPWTDKDTKLLPAPLRLRLALQELGPIYIKFGQLLSTRRDFLDQDVADELQILQDRVPPFSHPDIATLVETALNRPVAQVFSRLDPIPLASASVAQVHGAILVNGEEVVVKVVRPGIENIIKSDLALLKWLAAFIEGKVPIGRRLRPVEVINDYEKIILNELNLLAEGANTSQLRRNFENSPILYVPKVYWEFSSQNLLVMERIHGIPVSDIPALQRSGINLRKLAETGVEIFFTQVFEHSFFHADMHPGNIFVSTDHPENPGYIAIDCAIIGSLNQDNQLYLARNLLAIFKRDYRKVAQLHVECGWVPPDTPIPEFEAAMRTVCEPIFERPLKDISFGQLLVQLFRTAGQFNMEVQPSLVLLQKTLLNIEGLGRQLYPELDLWTTALPFLERWNRKRLSPVALVQKIGEHIPDWIDQLPKLPQLVIDSLTSNQQLTEINKSLRLHARQQAIRTDKLNQRLARCAWIILALAAITFALPVPSFLATVAEGSWILALFGLLLLLVRL